MSPYTEDSTKATMPRDAADFTGRWIDSLGNDVHVELVKGAPMVTLVNPTSGYPRTLWLFYDHRLHGWRCGNGLLSETVFGPGKSGKDNDKVLEFAAWITKDGRVSSWTRALVTTSEEDEPGTAPLPTRTSPDQETNGTQRPWRAKAPSGQAVSAQAASSEKQQEQEFRDSQPPKASRFQRSWYDMTEEWDKEGQEHTRGPTESLGAPMQSKEAGGESKTRKTRRGRRRPGRGVQC